MVGKGAKAQSGVSRVEVQMTVVVNEACGDNDMVCDSGEMSRVRPHSPWRRLEPSAEVPSTRVRRP
jgi:hypothetical protein